MNVIIVGGTGLLGYHATRELLAHGHAVSILALPPSPAEGLFPENVPILLENLDSLGDDRLLALLNGQDALIFAAGADDRITPKAPAYQFFYQRNVEPVRRLARLCVQSGVRKMVILGSYFAHFDRLWPQMKLTQHHPYIRSRVEQTRAAEAEGGENLAVMTLELPYIFGTMPGRIPLWKPLIGYIASGFPLFYPRGGTTCVTVRQVAQAIRGAVENGKAGARYPIGGENLTWVELLGLISAYAGKPKKVITLPDWLVRTGAGMIKLLHKLQGKEGGLDPVAFITLQTANTFIDATLTQMEMHYEAGGLEQALRETVAVCFKEKTP